MAELKLRFNWANHFMAWLGWACFYGLYSYFVAASVPFDWVDYLIYLAVHIASFYASVMWAFPYANPQWNRFNWQTGLRLGLVVILLVVCIPIVLFVLSVILGGLNVGLGSDAQTTTRIRNFADVVIFLYSGLIFALFYLKSANLEQTNGELQDEVATLKIQLTQAELENLEQSLVPHLYSNMLAIVNDAVRQQPHEAAYIVNTFNQLVRFYSGLEPHELVPLEEELHASELLLEIESVKLGKTPAINLEVEEAAKPLMVIPMLTILLLENMGKYGVVDDERNAAAIDISYRLGHLVIIAKNLVKETGNNPPMSTKKGLRSIKERLDSLKQTYIMNSEIENGAFYFALVLRIY